MFLLELVGEVHILLLGLVLAHSFLAIPGIPLGFPLNMILFKRIRKNKSRFFAHIFLLSSFLFPKISKKYVLYLLLLYPNLTIDIQSFKIKTRLEVHHAGPGGVAVAHAGLLEQRVDLQQLVVAEGLVDFVAHHVLGSLEVLVKSHVYSKI